MEGQNDFEQLLGPYGPCQILLQTDALDAWQLTIQENDCIGLIQEELVEHLQLNSQKRIEDHQDQRNRHLRDCPDD